MLLQRLISGIILIVPVVAAVTVGGIWMVLLILVLCVFLTVEFVHLVARRGHRAFGGLLFSWMLLFVADRAAPWLALLEPGMACLLILTLGWALVRFRQGTANAFTGFAMTLSGGLYLGWTAAHFVGLRAVEDGLFWTLIVLTSVWGADSAAYLVGRSIGRHKLAPDISPGKTWEGYLGGVLITPLMAVGLAFVWRNLGAGEAVTPERAVWLSTLIAAISPLGDLGISMLKRHVGAKDAGRVIPGHGGFLDRVDALLIAILIGYYAVTLFVQSP